LPALENADSSGEGVLQGELPLRESLQPPALRQDRAFHRRVAGSAGCHWQRNGCCHHRGHDARGGSPAGCGRGSSCHQRV